MYRVHYCVGSSNYEQYPRKILNEDIKDKTRFVSFFIDYLMKHSYYEENEKLTILSNVSYMTLCYITTNRNDPSCCYPSLYIKEEEIKDEILLNELKNNNCVVIGYAVIITAGNNNKGWRTIKYAEEFIKGKHIIKNLLLREEMRLFEETGEQIKFMFDNAHNFNEASIAFDYLDIKDDSDIDKLISLAFNRITNDISLQLLPLYNITYVYIETLAYLKRLFIDVNNDMVKRLVYKVFSTHDIKRNKLTNEEFQLYKTTTINKYIEIKTNVLKDKMNDKDKQNDIIRKEMLLYDDTFIV